MRGTSLSSLMTLALIAGLAGCTSDMVSVAGSVPAAPTDLTYVLEPSGDPLAPRGIILRWTGVADADLEFYQVYSRAGTSGSWGRRGTTTSPSFHDDGLPHLQYYVSAVSVGGLESEPSAYIEVDERLRLPKPASLTSISLDAAIHLQWPDNARLDDPAGFDHYRVYSSAYDLDANLCGTAWSLEGTTVATSFLVADITNGHPRCFGVSAITIEGFESLWSPLRYDTPRPDGRNLILYTAAADPNRSGFRFFLDANNDGLAGRLELGLIGAGASPSVDFVVQDDGTGTLFLAPVRAETELGLYGEVPVADLTSIDVAPVGGYSRTQVQAVPRWGYVFRMTDASPFYHYGAILVTATGTDYIIFDWSYQTDPGNPELIRAVTR